MLAPMWDFAEYDIFTLNKLTIQRGYSSLKIIFYIHFCWCYFSVTVFF